MAHHQRWHCPLMITARALHAIGLTALLILTLGCGGNTRGVTSTLSSTIVSGVSPATAAGPAAGGGAGAGLSSDWPCYHHDPARTGVSSDQEALGDVKQLWTSVQLDGENIYAQPLVAGNRVLAATEGNSVFALEASSGSVLWHVNFGKPVPGSALPCGNIDPSGITGTPVIDTSSGTTYVVAFLEQGPHHELFALDLATGATRWHKTVDPPGLSPLVEQERAALALAGGRVYVAYGGLFGDCGNYKGAVVSVAADGSGSPQSYVMPTQREAGLWNPTGPVVDANGDLWVVTGNSQSQGAFDYGNAVIRLSPDLSVQDYFAPEDWARLNAGDLDLGSLGAALLPGGKVFAAGKTGTAYLLDAGNLGHVSAAVPTTDLGSSPFGSTAVVGSRVVVPCTGALVAVDVSSKALAVAWSVPGGSGSPIIAAGHMWSLGYDGKLRAIDPSSGAVVFTLQLGQPATRFITPSAAAGRLFVADGRTITAIALR